MEALATFTSESAGLEQSVWERILLHLLDQQGAVSEYDAPRAATTRGIRGAVGVGKDRIARDLQKMTVNGVVAWGLRHIDGGARARVYWLTEPGLYMARELNAATRRF